MTADGEARAAGAQVPVAAVFYNGRFARHLPFPLPAAACAPGRVDEIARHAADGA